MSQDYNPASPFGSGLDFIYYICFRFYYLILFVAVSFFKSIDSSSSDLLRHYTELQELL